MAVAGVQGSMLLGTKDAGCILMEKVHLKVMFSGAKVLANKHPGSTS